MSNLRGFMPSRRQVLQLTAAFAVSGAVMPAHAIAAVENARTGTTPKMLDDGHLPLTNGFVFPDTPAETLGSALGSADPDTPMLLPCTVPLLRHDGRVILFDAGSGPAFMEGAGLLLASLAAAGLAPEDVTDVVFTHGHPDHLWGVTDDFDEIAFPAATFHMPSREFDFWMAEETMASVPQHLQSFVAGAQSRLPRLAERMSFFEDGAEPLPGVEAFATNGHSPGHCSYVLHLDDGPLLLTGDVFSHPLTVAHPDWTWGTDQDPDAARVQRHRMIDRIAADKLRVAVFHMSAPGFGTIERNADGARWVAEA